MFPVISEPSSTGVKIRGFVMSKHHVSKGFPSVLHCSQGIQKNTVEILI